jgi:hypothetical protein
MLIIFFEKEMRDRSRHLNVLFQDVQLGCPTPQQQPWEGELTQRALEATVEFPPEPAQPCVGMPAIARVAFDGFTLPSSRPWDPMRKTGKPHDGDLKHGWPCSWLCFNIWSLD